MPLEIKTLVGHEMLPHLEALAKLRISVFREFPYCYNGSLDYEQSYLAKFSETADALLVLALDGDRVVGASSGLPMAHESPEVRKTWEENGFDCGRIFYFAESVLAADFRGKGIGVHFFEAREKWAQSLGRFHLCCFCALVRPTDHPLRPSSYLPLDRFWQKRGFAPAHGYTCQMRWPDVGHEQETTKTLQFWSKLMPLRK